MATNTTNFNIVLPEGSDTFNPLTFNNNAFSLIDEQMKKNQDAGITTATHTFIDGINTILRAIASCNMLVFVASADYVAGSTIAVDGVTCTLRYADGTAPKSNAFRTNQAVLCYLNGTILTLISAKASVEDALIGNLEDLTTDDKATIVGAVNEVVEDVTDLNSKLNGIGTSELLYQGIPNKDFVPATVESMAQFRSIRIVIGSSASNIALATSEIPLDIWGSESYGYLRAYNNDTTYGDVSYTSDTKIQVRGANGIYVSVYGIR